ncbi:phosphate transporter PHO1 homolog 10-like isoform X3 [Salvia miltiorrhiza]|uniref:phosphate transporter PHO1 homolog 10-like isoform X3 n=1 Tax=Salvia miltiorrhiza TaxID=226208 RepID=UPI0025ABB3C2|nr:phosphate transporter PHO1 homolog 10-like isoform X3 [Salvia miltiorrhiza]
MKFGKEFKKQKVSEWTEAYVDYNGLKHILHGIRSFRQNNPNLARASSKRLSLKNFNSSSLHESNIDNHDDIENQVIVVHTVHQENSRKLYNTRLIVSPTEGEGNERIFFKKLDDELNMTNNFYKDKVEEMIREAALLKKQMETLVALRIKVTNPSSHGLVSLKSVSTEINNLEPSKIIPPGKAEIFGQVDRKAGVEMSCRSQQQPGSSGVDLSFQERHSDSHPVVDVLHRNNSTNGEITDEYETSNLEILDRIKISNTYDSPMSTIRGVFTDTREKGLSYNKEELKEVEERLKIAFIEFYQKLCLLKHYSFMNMCAFSKILKKYDKITSRFVARSYMKIVDDSYIGSSDEVTNLMERVEAVFIKNFLNSNRQEGMKLLRPIRKIERHRITFCSGFFSGCTVALIVAVILLIEDRKLMQIKSATLYIEIIFPLYGFFTFTVLHMLVYAANMYFWRRYKINYPFIFGFRQGTELGYREVFLLSSVLGVMALATFLVHMHIKMDSETQHYETYIELLPLGLIIVTLPDFFLADQLTSQVQAIRNFEYYICFYGGRQLTRRLKRCSNNEVYNVFYFVLAVVPYWFRFLQCVRRLFEERDSVHGYNGLRYFTTIVAVVIRTAFEFRKKIAWKVLALLSSAVAAIANTYWDIVVDWGLLQRRSKNLFLRDKLIVPHKNVYFVAMVLDILLRFAWLQLVLILDVHSLHGKTVSTIFSCLEILRRGLWNFFRLENEHLNNVGKFRAFKSVPLPFTYYEDKDDNDGNERDEKDE